MSHSAAIPKSHSDATTLASWGFAVALATLGTAVLWQASIGINWGVWITCVVIACFAILRDRYGSVGAPTLVAAGWAVVLAFGTAVTSNGVRVAMLVLATIVLLAIALTTAGDVSLDILRPLLALQAPFVALKLVCLGLGSEASGRARAARAPATASLVRATAITLPITFVLILLLAEADPTFAAARNALEHIVPDDFVGRAFLFALLFGVTLGACSTAQHGQLTAHTPAQPGGVTLGALERRVLMSALASIMWLFVGSATVSLLQNPAAIAGSGITYAEYVHRGFAELSVAATIVIGATLVSRRSWIGADTWARRIAAAAIAGECGMIAIAFMRIVRYEQAYGFTTMRLYAQGYMIVLACMSALLLLEIARRRQSSRFAFHSASAGLAIMAASVFFNTDAWIVRENMHRYAVTGLLDAQYLRLLSDDAIPAIVESVPHLHEVERDAVVAVLLDRKTAGARARSSQWYEWNYRASKSAAVLRDFREKP